MNWDRFEDSIDWMKFEQEGISELRRRLVKDDRYVDEHIVAKGITAFLSFENILNYGYSFRLKLEGRKIIELEDEIYLIYFKKCFNFLSNDNKKEPFKYNRKSEIELIHQHIENEKQLLTESQLFFGKVSESKIPIIKKIKESALYYQNWLEEEFIKTSSPPQPKQTNESRTKIPSKYYALYHWILIEIGKENDFEQDENDQYKRYKIEAYAKEKYPDVSEQGFYRAYIGIDLTNKIAIANSFGAGYKDKIIEISNNNTKVIIHLKDYPN